MAPGFHSGPGIHYAYFFTLLNDIEKPDQICSPTFVVDEYSGLFLHPSIFSIKHSISA